jgi:hypothetical protein
MIKLAVLLPLALALAATPAVAASGLLDGKTFTGSIGLKGKPADGKDDLIFANGMLHSTACDAYGFTPGPYVAVRSGDVTTFTATTRSPKEGTINWQGTVRNGVLEGTFTCKKTLIRRNYWIKATEK